MKKQRLILLFIALFLIALSWWNVAAARSQLIVRSIERNGVPMLYIAPQNAANIPGILIAHGFAGSKQLMLGYGHVLAHAGYATILWDFGGHGANAAPLKRFTLQQDLNTALTVLLEQPEVDATRLALLGHSMGSGAVMETGIGNANRFAATIAISPTGASVTPFTPRNLQLQAGSWEGGFIRNAQRLLKAAGGENQNLSQGKGRELVTVPHVEHITILFSNDSQQAARRWLDATFGNPNTSTYIDRRMVWYGLHLAGWLMVLAAVAPTLIASATAYPVRVPSIRNGFGLLIAPFVASAVLVLISRLGEIQSLGGLMVGGALAIWFCIAGLVRLGVLLHLPHPKLQSLRVGVALFVLLWMAFGSMAQVVWLQWWLIPGRLQLVPVLAIACFPYFLASGIAQQGASPLNRLAGWFLEITVLIAGLLVAISLLPQLSFIFLVLPVFPPIFGIFAFAAAQLDDAWSYALGSTVFFAWMIATAFPLAA